MHTNSRFNDLLSDADRAFRKCIERYVLNRNLPPSRTKTKADALWKAFGFGYINTSKDDWKSKYPPESQPSQQVKKSDDTKEKRPSNPTK